MNTRQARQIRAGIITARYAMDLCSRWWDPEYLYEAYRQTTPLYLSRYAFEAYFAKRGYGHYAR